MFDQTREKPVSAIHLPEPLRELLNGRTWTRNTVGESGCTVYRLSTANPEADLYLKHGHGPASRHLSEELVRLRWLGKSLPVPRVLQFTELDDDAWLLMTAIPGRTAYQVLQDHPEHRESVVDALAAFLKRLHAIPAETCPFTTKAAYRLNQAQQRLEAGLVNEDDFDEERQGLSARQLWEQMMTLHPCATESVVTHGDYSLDNLFLHNGQVVGCIDAGRVGLADPYQDLAILHNCLGEFGASLQGRLFQAYGIRHVDERRLNFHLILDEFF
jgi:aminoglycoside 3'-phosphotransferase-1